LAVLIELLLLDHPGQLVIVGNVGIDGKFADALCQNCVDDFMFVYNIYMKYIVKERIAECTLHVIPKTIHNRPAL
jgi:hypothetical protein